MWSKKYVKQINSVVPDTFFLVPICTYGIANKKGQYVYSTVMFNTYCTSGKGNQSNYLAELRALMS